LNPLSFILYEFISGNSFESLYYCRQEIRIILFDETGILQEVLYNIIPNWQFILKSIKISYWSKSFHIAYFSF